METTKQPYELLVRWGPDGKLKGAHIQWCYVTTDGGKRVSESVGDAEPVDVSKGFPLQDVLNKAQAEALEGLSKRDEAIAALSTDLRKTKTMAEGAGNLIKRMERDIDSHRGATMAGIAFLGMKCDWLIAELSKATSRSAESLNTEADDVVKTALQAAKRKA